MPRTQVLVRRSILGLVALFCSLPAWGQLATINPRITEALNENQLVTLEGQTHPLARPEFDRGPAPDDLPMKRMLLVLQRGQEQERGLQKLLDEQQDLSSPNYHQWLTPEQFGKQFGPADSDLQAVSDWLTTQGFEVGLVSPGRVAIEFSGTAGQISRALHTEIHKFAVGSKEHWANAGDPRIPAALAPVISGIVSLNNFPRKPLSRPSRSFARSKVTGEILPLFTFTPRSQTYNALGPTDFATIYNVLPLWQAGTDGTGQTIAIVGESNINAQDVRDFRTLFGLLPNEPNIILNGPDPGVNSAEGEADLDVEWAGAVARNATIDLVVSESTESTFGIDLSALFIVDNNLASVMSESFGSCEANLGNGGNAFYATLWQQAAAQGITVVVSSGDSGSAECDRASPNVSTAASRGLAVTGVASTPYNVAVGGTEFDDGGSPALYWNPLNTAPSQSSAKSYIPEIPWNDSCARLGLAGCSTVSSGGADLVAGGGGPSNCVISTGFFPNFTCNSGYPKPSWQTGNGVPNDGVRDLPDVSLFAGDGRNHTFYIFCQSSANPNRSSCDLNAPYQNFQGSGGTSFSAPAFAGIMALVNQKTGMRQGNANYVLYPLAAQKGATCPSNPSAVNASSCLFYDVITGNNAVACQGGTLNCSASTAGQFGVMVNPKDLNSPAWTATAGYDLATGLGTVNAANLVNAWTSVSFAPTTTTLTLSTTPATNPIKVAHGQPVNFTVNVSSTSGIPTGAVSLIAGVSKSGGSTTNATTGVDVATLANGVASGSTRNFPGGTFGVTAHYAGDGRFGASDSSPPVQVTVTPEASVTRVGLVTFSLQTGQVTSSNATTTAYGSPYVLRANVLNGAGEACAPQNIANTIQGIPVFGCPTGTLTITANGNPLPNQDAPSATSYPLNSHGYTEDRPIQFPAGNYNVVATYPGDNSFTPSASGPVAMSITQAATTLSLTANSTSVASGASVILTATVNTQSNGDAPTGSVTFSNGSSPISGAVTYTSNSGKNAPAQLQATLTTSFSASATIQAQYSGDPNYIVATSAPPLSITVTAALPDFTLTANPSSFNIASPGQSNTTGLTATATGGFTGTVTLTCSLPVTMKEATCALDPASLTTSGTTTLTVKTTAPHVVGMLVRDPAGWFGPSAGFLLFFVVLLLTFVTKSRQMRIAGATLLFAIVATGIFACGGGGGSPAPPPTTDPGTASGTYSVTVTGASGTLTHTSNISVVVM